MIVLSAPLFHAGTSPVIFAKDLKGDSGRHVQGVRAVIVKQIDRPWGLIADHPDNEGTSVAEAFLEYANAVCDPAGMQIEDLVWFGLGKDGRFYAWTGATLEIIDEASLEAGSRQAFQARLSRMGMRCDGGGVRMMLDSVQEPYLTASGMHLN